MKFGLAAYEFKNDDLSFNLAQIEKALIAGSNKGLDIILFGEAFLQGFDGINFDFENDKKIAIATNSKTMIDLCELTKKYSVDLGIGYFELADNSIYSSYAIIGNGNIIYNYRRISTGWKEEIADRHYKEGDDSKEFIYKGQSFKIALCGDLWVMNEKFATKGILIWPIYVNFNLDDLYLSENDYLNQAMLASDKCLLINSITYEPIAHGGAFYYESGRIEKRLAYDLNDILVVEI